MGHATPAGPFPVAPARRRGAALPAGTLYYADLRGIPILAIVVPESGRKIRCLRGLRAVHRRALPRARRHLWTM